MHEGTDASMIAGKLSKPGRAFDLSGGFRCGSLVGRTDCDRTVTAKPIVAERLVFPAAPKYDPLPFMDDKTGEMFDRPLDHGKEPSDIVEKVPIVHIRADPSNKIALLKKLADSGRLQPVPSSCKRGRHISGLFSVGKDLHRDRLILDARPSNLLEAPLTKWTASVGAGANFCDVLLSDEQVLLGSGQDLKDFFYQFRVSPQRVQRNILADPSVHC